MEKIELTRKEWEDFEVYLDFKARKKKPCHSCPIYTSCLMVPKNKCEELNDWIKAGDELYSKVSQFIDTPELAALAKVMLDRMQMEESIKYLKALVARAEGERFKLLQSENSLFTERIIIKE